MIKALLIDFDGVLRRWNQDDAALAERSAGLPAGAVLRSALEPALLLPAITGRISDEAWRQTIVERLSTAYPGARAEAAVQAWAASAGEVDPAVLSLIHALPDGVATLLVTNATTRLPSDLERLGLTTTFTQVINSSDIGHAKPDPGFFRQALAAAGVLAAEALLVDDDARNIDSAARLGMVGHHFRDAPSLKLELIRHHLIG